MCVGTEKAKPPDSRVVQWRLLPVSKETKSQRRMICVKGSLREGAPRSGGGAYVTLDLYE